MTVNIPLYGRTAAENKNLPPEQSVREPKFELERK